MLVLLRAAGLAVLAGMVGGCATIQPAGMGGTRPVFHLEQFYTGHTRSNGFIESRTGAPIKRVATETWGRSIAGDLHMIQDVTIDGGKPVRRTWRMHRQDAHHYDAFSENVIGAACGEDWGNTSRLTYILALDRGNPFSRVRMTHWMSLQPDQRTMLNRVVVSKAGIVLAQISEVFQKADDKGDKVLAITRRGAIGDPKSREAHFLNHSVTRPLRGYLSPRLPPEAAKPLKATPRLWLARCEWFV